MASEKHTLDLIDTEGVNEKGMELLRKLNVVRKYCIPYPNNSVMEFGSICEHDDGWLCEHRLQVIADWLKQNQNG